MNYTFHQLQIFLKIVQLQSITKAAEELHLTQPAVSIQLKNLQEQFDIPLTEVVGRRIYVTDFGKEIAVIAARIVEEVQALNHKALSFKGQLAGKLKLSTVSTGKYVMPYFLGGFLQLHPGVELQMDVTNKSKVIESLENNEVDFSLVSILPANLSLQSVELMDNRLYLVGNHQAQLPSSPDIKTVFQDLPLIFREPGSGTRETMERFLNQHKLSFRKKLELTSNEAVKQAVLAGLGFSIMPLIGIRNEIKMERLKVLPVEGLPIMTKWQLIWMNGKNLTPVAQSFLDYIDCEKELILQEFFVQDIPGIG